MAFITATPVANRTESSPVGVTVLTCSCGAVGRLNTTNPELVRRMVERAEAGHQCSGQG